MDVNEPPEYESSEVRLEASNPESDVLTSSLTGADSALFTISSPNGQITLFKSQGLALEDLAAAEIVYERAKEQGVGVTLPG